MELIIQEIIQKIISHCEKGVKSKIVCKLPRLLNSNQPDTQQQ